MIIALAQSKGGSGKTTVAQVILGSVADRGHSVAAIDSDFNSTLYNWIENFSKYPIEGHAELDETKIVPLAGELEEKHDLVVIDTAGAATQATVFAIGCADIVLIPIQLSSSDIIEAIKTNRLVQSAGKMMKRALLMGSSTKATMRPPAGNQPSHRLNRSNIKIPSQKLGMAMDTVLVPMMR